MSSPTLNDPAAVAAPRQTAERRSTDESLDDERCKTDRELVRSSQRVAAVADDAILSARERSDAALRATREAADVRAKRGEGVRRERAQEDAVVDSERTTENQSLKDERVLRSEALAELFRLERDQTDLYLLTERARSDEAVTTRDTFLAMVAHDLRTMIHGIDLTAAALAGDCDAARGTTGRARAQMVQRYTARMSKLIADLLDVASVETGRLVVLPERRDLTRLIREAEEGALPVARARGILFTSEIVGRPLAAPFDHERILQVLANLITNAIKFTPAGGQVTLSVEAKERECRFSVRDTGSGIAREKLEAIFQRFWQVSSNDRRGLGLGLYISKSIVEAHGGRIWAESVEGGGTTLSFTLPAAPESGQP